VRIRGPSIIVHKNGKHYHLPMTIASIMWNKNMPFLLEPQSKILKGVHPVTRQRMHVRRSNIALHVKPFNKRNVSNANRLMQHMLSVHEKQQERFRNRGIAASDRNMIKTIMAHYLQQYLMTKNWVAHHPNQPFNLGYYEPFKRNLLPTTARNFSTRLREKFLYERLKRMPHNRLVHLYSEIIQV
jgi:hypothetical protein